MVGQQGGHPGDEPVEAEGRGRPDYRAEQSAQEIPVGEYGRPADIADLVCFLVSPRARSVTGTVIPVDGGDRGRQPRDSEPRFVMSLHEPAEADVVAGGPAPRQAEIVVSAANTHRRSHRGGGVARKRHASRCRRGILLTRPQWARQGPTMTTGGRMNRVSTLGLVALLSVTLVSGCGGPDSPHRLTRHFARSGGDTRVFERYAGSTPDLSRTVRLDAGVRLVFVHLDCVDANGSLSVSLAGFGTGSLSCSERGGAAGIVGLGSGPATKLRGARSARLRISAPVGTRWSVAVDTSTRDHALL